MTEQFEINRRRVQQLFRQYRQEDEIPTVETTSRSAYADYPDNLESQVVAVHEMLGCGAVAVARVLRVEDGLTNDNNPVHAILKEHDTVTENPNKQGRLVRP